MYREQQLLTKVNESIIEDNSETCNKCYEKDMCDFANRLDKTRFLRTIEYHNDKTYCCILRFNRMSTRNAKY